MLTAMLEFFRANNISKKIYSQFNSPDLRSSKTKSRL